MDRCGADYCQLYNLRIFCCGRKTLRRAISLSVAENIADEPLRAACRKRLVLESGFFLLFFLTWLVYLLCSVGFAVNAAGLVYLEPYKYLHNLQAMPVVTAVLVIGVLMVLGGMLKGWRGWKYAFWLAGPGSVLVVLALLLCAGWNNTSFYPSVADLQSSLTLANSSSGLFTLKTMTYVSFIIPFVIAYIAWAWHALDKEPITAAETEEH